MNDYLYEGPPANVNIFPILSANLEVKHYMILLYFVYLSIYSVVLL